MARRIKSKKRKYLGNRSYGRGNTKNGRGKGTRGGVGRAGYHKHKWLKTIKEGLHKSRRHGFVNRNSESVLTTEITLAQLQRNVDKGLYKKSADGKYEVTLPVRAKVLSQGTLTAALKISAGAFSAVAKEKIAKAGGQVLESA
jgi:large subunit ribosomal protein L15